jgi:hypothetical protein
MHGSLKIHIPFFVSQFVHEEGLYWCRQMRFEAFTEQSVFVAVSDCKEASKRSISFPHSTWTVLLY